MMVSVSETVTVQEAFERKLLEQPGVVLRHDGNIVRHLVPTAANASDVRYWETADHDGGGVRVYQVGGQEVIEVERVQQIITIPIMPNQGRIVYPDGREWHGVLPSSYYGKPVSQYRGVLLVDESEEDRSSHKWVALAWVALAAAVALVAVMGVLVLRGVR
jgi:hypothetical protein